MAVAKNLQAAWQSGALSSIGICIHFFFSAVYHCTFIVFKLFSIKSLLMRRLSSAAQALSTDAVGHAA